ncbi:MAG: hypothetical protein ACK5GJ_18795, partial [Planctomycetota bacterium]
MRRPRSVDDFSEIIVCARAQPDSNRQSLGHGCFRHLKPLHRDGLGKASHPDSLAWSQSDQPK